MLPTVPDETMPIEVRLSSASSTSGGSEMFSMTNFGTAMPRSVDSSSVSRAASWSPRSPWCAATSMTGMPDDERTLAKWLTTFWRRYSCTSSVRNWGSVPTSSRSSSRGSETLAENAPKARTRTMPSSGSRIMTGFLVPHLRSVNWRVLTK